MPAGTAAGRSGSGEKCRWLAAGSEAFEEGGEFGAEVFVGGLAVLFLWIGFRIGICEGIEFEFGRLGISGGECSLIGVKLECGGNGIGAEGILVSVPHGAFGRKFSGEDIGVENIDIFEGAEGTEVDVVGGGRVIGAFGALGVGVELSAEFDDFGAAVVGFGFRGD